MATFHGITARSRVDALSYAIASGKIKQIELLLADGTDVNARTSSGDTPLGLACASGSFRTVTILLNHGANVDIIASQNMTPLMIACARGQLIGSRIALQLIESGANVSIERKTDQMTALKFAVRRCSISVLQALIDNGATVDGPIRTRQTALMLAARHNNVPALRLLIENGANVNRRSTLPWAKGLTATEIAELEKRNAAVRFLRSQQD